MGSTVHIVVTTDSAPADVASELLAGATERTEGISNLVKFLKSLPAGTRNGKVTTRVDSSVAIAATKTITPVYDDFTTYVAGVSAADTIVMRIPGMPDAILTAVTGTADSSAGEFSVDTSSNACATSIAAAVAAYPPFRDFVSATDNTGSVTLTAKKLGTIGNSYTLHEIVTTATATDLTSSPVAFTGGVDPGAAPTGCVLTITHSGGNILQDDDTILVGGTTFTWKADPSGESQVDIGTSATEDAANLVAAVNAHSALQGLVTASNVAGVVTFTYWAGGRDGEAFEVREGTDANAAMSVATAKLAGTATDTYQAAAVTWKFGMV